MHQQRVIVTGKLRVVSTNYEQAVMYWCMKVLPNGLCDDRQVHVGIWVRRLDEGIPMQRFDPFASVPDTCVSRDDFISTSSGGSRVFPSPAHSGRGGWGKKFVDG